MAVQNANLCIQKLDTVMACNRPHKFLSQLQCSITSALFRLSEPHWNEDLLSEQATCHRAGNNKY